MGYFIAANWKMHKTPTEAETFCADLKEKLEGIRNTAVLIAPAYPALERTVKCLKGSGITTAAQDIHYEKEGAFTGAVSVDMIKDAGCDYVIVGHSERRNMFGDTDETVGKKLEAVLEGGLKAILCVGEKLEEREAGKTPNVVERQLKAALANRGKGRMEDVIVAYEPVWAIGTGKTASPGDVQEVHNFIKEFLGKEYGADNMTVLYGGSVKPANVEGLLEMSDIDGGLIGGAALEVDSFAEIIRKAEDKTL